MNSGHVLGINQTVGNFYLNLEGNPSTTTFDAVGSTITGSVGSFDLAALGDANGNGDGGIGLLGTTTIASTGFLGASGNYMDFSFPSASIALADVAAPNGVVIQQAKLVNDGEIVGSEGGAVTLTSASADALLVNDGDMFNSGDMTIGVAIGGTGRINEGATVREGNGHLDLEKAVSSGQTLETSTGDIDLGDPLGFRATIAGFGYQYDTAAINFGQQVTRAYFDAQNRLEMWDGVVLVAALQFDSATAPANVIVNSSGGSTSISESLYAGDVGNIPVGIGPVGGPPLTLPPLVLPSGPILLPNTGPDQTFTGGAAVASIQRLSGYTITLNGGSASSSPSVNISSVVFGANFALDTVGGGTLNAVGYNENDGMIAVPASAVYGTNALAFDISDDVSPDGTVILAGAYNNTGEITVGAQSSADITGTPDSKLINSGTIKVSGSAFIGPTVTGSGSMVIGDASDYAYLEIGSEVSTGQKVTFNQGDLQLDDPSKFFATIYGFNPNDNIIIKGSVGQAVLSDDNGAVFVAGAGTLHFNGEFPNYLFLASYDADSNVTGIHIVQGT